ncbi:MAG: UDP-glucose 4-epimerase GalE [Fibrobacterota bacterium]
MNPTVLVVGGAGYIGSHCVKMLARAGHRVITYDSLVRGHRDAVRYGDFVKGDLGDSAKLSRLFTDRHVDAVMHFAAFASVAESVAHPAMYFENNFEKTKTLLDVMLEHRVTRFIFSSTAATFGVPAYVPMDEAHPQAPINPYGESKRKVERLLSDYDARLHLRFVAFRYFNAAGCDPEGELGERHDPETHLVPLALRAALGTGTPLSVFGDDYATPDGTCVRDYIHVNDLCGAHILGLEYLLREDRSNVFNLGNGSGFSVKEIITAVEKVTGKKVPYTMGPRRPGDPPVLIANPALAQRVLGWKTGFPGVEQIIATAHRWETKAVNSV